MRTLGIDPALRPPLREPGSTIGVLSDDVLAQSGLVGPVPVVAVGSRDTAWAVVGGPAADETFACTSCGTCSLVGTELDAPVLTEASRAANFTIELGADGTVRYLRNVMRLWLLQESLRYLGGGRHSGRPGRGAPARRRRARPARGRGRRRPVTAAAR